MSPNQHLCASIYDSTLDTDFPTDQSHCVSKTELDSHANVAVAGKHCTVISDGGKTARVKAFSPDCDTLENVKMVDIAEMLATLHMNVNAQPDSMERIVKVLSVYFTIFQFY